MLLYSRCGKDISFSDQELTDIIQSCLTDACSSAQKVLILPPDITRFHSRAGVLTKAAAEFYKGKSLRIVPALGTHSPMTADEKDRMFPGVDPGLFRDHQWRSDLIRLGTVPGEFVSEVSEGRLSFDWPVDVNRRLLDNQDLILSIGQVVPHEVVGFANHSKNIFIGTGGSEAIHKSHFLGAVHGMERIMGRVDSPVRSLLDYASDQFAGNLPIVYVLTVVVPDENGINRVRGLFIGSGRRCFEKAAAFSREVNCINVDKPLSRVVVVLNPDEYRSTWLGNKAIYRTRLALADGAELTVLAPGLRSFAEDSEMDGLIRKYGYCGTEQILGFTETEDNLKNNLAVAAHLIHGSTEGRFSVCYGTEFLSREEVESIGYRWKALNELERLFQANNKPNGYQLDAEGNSYYLINNPALGLWTV